MMAAGRLRRPSEARRPGWARRLRLKTGVRHQPNHLADCRSPRNHLHSSHVLVGTIRRCLPADHTAILAIINVAAERYRGAIPIDCWHEPYMPAEQFERDVAAGVAFWAYVDEGGEPVGVMGLQPVSDVDLVRHAYVRPDRQGQGVGGRLLRYIEGLSARRILIGTWADATWAIRFYQGHDYTLVPPGQAAELLRRYWTISPRQLETSVVLAKPPIVGQATAG